MSNPYEPTHAAAVIPGDGAIHKVSVKPIDLLMRAKTLLGDQYWLFFAMTLVGMIVGSLVPFGIILGAILVGIYYAFIDREQGRPVEFATLFKGFDQFGSTVIAMLILMGLMFAVMIPCFICMMVMLFSLTPQNGGQGGEPPVTFFVLLLAIYLIMILAIYAVSLPFVFTFQLIADRRLAAVAAIKTSARGVGRNLGGIIWFMIVMGFISLVATMLCYLPVFLLLPLQFGAMFLLYRDIYGPGPATA